MKKKIDSAYLPVLIGIAIAIGIFIGNNLKFNSDTSNLFKANFSNNKFDKLITYINEEYVDDVDTDSIVEIAINNILTSLDPHSTYIPASMHQGIKERMDGSFVGIGVEFRLFRDTVLVINVIKGGPSEKAGLHNGDRILLAGTDTIYGKKKLSESVISKLKGVKDSKIDLTIFRPSSKKTLVKSVVRGSIPIKSVDVAYMINDTLAYVKVNRFAATTFDEFDKALGKVKAEGMKSLILDLRDNPGGFMHIAKQIADEFLPANKLIVFTKNRKGETNEDFSTVAGKLITGNVFILINEGSASASEVVAGALQDNDRATIIGRRSFGKGLVQQEIDFNDGSAVRLTTARYYTPTGRSIQKPYSKGTSVYNDDYTMRIHNGELLNADSIKVDEKEKFTTPKGKIVYGGGGIIPDVFVPVDTTQYENWLYKAVRLSNLNNFFIDFADNNRTELEELGYKNYLSSFDKDDKVYNSFIEFIRKKGIETTDNKQVKKVLKLRIKAFLARLIWGDESIYPIWEEVDNMVIRIKEIGER